MSEKTFTVNCNELARKDPLKIAVNSDMNIRMMQYSDLVHLLGDSAFKDVYEAQKKGSCIVPRDYSYMVTLTSGTNPHIYLTTENKKGLLKTTFGYDNSPEADIVLYDLIDLFDIFHALETGRFHEIPEIGDAVNRTYNAGVYSLSIFREHKAFAFEKKERQLFYRYE